MARVMEKIVPVKIMAEEINCYSTMERSCISAITACLRVRAKAVKDGDTKKVVKIDKQIEVFHSMKKQAIADYDNLVAKSMNNNG